MIGDELIKEGFRVWEVVCVEGYGEVEEAVLVRVVVISRVVVIVIVVVIICICI